MFLGSNRGFLWEITWKRLKMLFSFIHFILKKVLDVIVINKWLLVNHFEV